MRKFLAPFAALALVLAMVGTVLAWPQPTLTSDCAPDANSFAWKINLASGEPDYNIDWSFDSGFAGATTVDFVSAGDHSFLTPRGGTTLYVRWSIHDDVTAQAEANTELCEQESESEAQSESEAESESPSGEQSVEAGTGTPNATIPDASLNGNGPSPLPTILFSMVLLASLSALAYTNVKIAKGTRPIR